MIPSRFGAGRCPLPRCMADIPGAGGRAFQAPGWGEHTGGRVLRTDAGRHSAVLLEDNTIADVRREHEDSRPNHQTYDEIFGVLRQGRISPVTHDRALRHLQGRSNETAIESGGCKAPSLTDALSITDHDPSRRSEKEGDILHKRKRGRHRDVLNDPATVPPAETGCRWGAGGVYCSRPPARTGWVGIR